MRYGGAKTVTIEPQWFAETSLSSSNAELQDPILGVRWVAVFKGGVYGVQNDRSFLLLPRPEYGGAERLGFDGDWLVISAWRAIDGTDRTSQVRPVARYNRRTRELRLINEGVR